MNREAIFGALFALSESIEWGTPARGWQTRSRRVKLFSDVPVDQQPAIFQAEHDEVTSQQSNMPYKWVLKAQWIIYQATGNNPDGVPAIENNLILDAVQAAFAPQPSDPGYPKRNTLGGLVHHCYIDGSVFKDPGDIDNQGMMVIPILMLVPE